MDPTDTAEIDLVAPATVMHRQQQWATLQPALSRLGQPAAGPGSVVAWLDAPHVGSEHEAERARIAIGRERWSLQCADGGFVLQAGEHAWMLRPLPAHQPLAWRVSRA